ncbi:MAG TPA: hypothetical protein V6C72_15110, partial [Chroococcales cyanobacterium]
DLSILYYSSEYTQTPEERARTLEQLRATDPVRADAFDLAGTQTRIKQLEIQRCDFDISIPEAVYNEAL